ncbi:MAG TPA: allantoate amidohydrolase [Ktedonosporobacter sp.]|jgi:allantoate deiminase|nr:allantoate amidohydrolase [Ktedonosporobacter sp.]
MLSIETSAHMVMERCDALARFSEEPDRLTRRFATPPMRQVNQQVAAWMRAAGMDVHEDNIGNVIGRHEADRANAPTLLLGSHLDTVRDAGKYDGPLGVMIALACVERLHASQQRLPFAIEVLGFADEEGLRFHSAYLGSNVVAGTLNPEVLDWTDSDGITLAQAIRTFGGDPENLLAAKRNSDDLLGYCEVHIEQGPVLESLDLPVGVVTAITGHSRIMVSFTGMAGHAGTVPMSLRRDALCAAAEFILAVEQMGRSDPGLITTVGQVSVEPGLVATVGQVTVEPGASNVIPGKVVLSLDVRHQDDATRMLACQQLRAQAHKIGTAREIAVAWQPMQENGMVPCTPHLIDLLSQAVKQQGYPVHLLPSGAGHDAVTLVKLTNVAMLFVRCKGGISHNPAEAVTAQDVATAIQVMEQFFTLLAQSSPP